MRTITDHKLNGLNEALTVIAVDQPGPGGANHQYIIGDESGERAARALLNFQNGPINEAGVNGISNEALLAVLIDRLRGFQFGRVPTAPREIAATEVNFIMDKGFDFSSRGQYACRENACALTHLEEALMWLQKRTRDRLARGVEGTSAK